MIFQIRTDYRKHHVRPASGRVSVRCAKLAIAIIICMLAALAAPFSHAAAQTDVNTRIGLRFGAEGSAMAVPSANLQNADGSGRGFEFGYFDANRNFVPIGARTEESGITMLMDRNMVWHPNALEGGIGEFREGSFGNVVVGAFHIQLDLPFESFEQAKAAADEYADAFVKFESGRFFVSLGNYTSRADAGRALSDRGFAGMAEVNAGTQYTVSVVITGTNTILFEFDFGDTYHLGVKPIPISGENPETWFRGQRYNGGFQFARLEGVLLTVVNFVNMEDYTKGVIPYEMANNWPLEALKAQAVGARSYAQAYPGRHGTHGFDLCDTTHCQVYRGRASANERTDQAVDETSGVFMMHEGTVVRAYYSASNGGASENSENVWVEAVPYLRGVIDPYEVRAADRMWSGYQWTRTHTPQALANRLRGMGHSVGGSIVSMRISEFSPTGNVLSVTMTDSNGANFTVSRRSQLIAALEIRTQRFTMGETTFSGAGLHVNNPAQELAPGLQYYALNGNGEIVALPQGTLLAVTGTGSAVPITGETSGGAEIRPVNGVFTITGWGNGHNVGMSQWGAFSMAHYFGMDYVDILTFYFTGVTIGTLD